MSDCCKIIPKTPDNDNYQALSGHANPHSDVIPKQADDDEQLILLWLNGRSKHTQRAYSRDVAELQKWSSKGVRQIVLANLQEYGQYLQQKQLAPGSVRRSMASIKSLFAFAHKIGYIIFDVGRPLRVPASRDNLAQRILSEEEVQEIIHNIENKRNSLLIKTLYYTGVRISELVALKWQDLQVRDSGGQMVVMGKGEKTNVILIPEHLWNELQMLRGCSSDDDPVFESQKGGHLDPGYVCHLVKKISMETIGKKVTPHWFRHSHASHALDNGCPIHLVQKQLNHASVATTGRYLHARPTESSSKYLKE